MQQLISLGVNERRIMLSNYLQSEVSKVLGLPASQLPDTQIGFFDMGMDSLMMVELRSQVERSLDKTIAATALFEHPNIQSLAEYLATEILPIHTNIETVDMVPPASCEDVDDAIAQELAALEAILGG